MRIAQVSPVYPPRGGIGTVAKQYTDQLRAQGHDVVAFVPHYDRRDQSEDVHWLKGVFSWGNASLVPSLLGKLKGFDVIHLHYPFYGGALFAALASLFTGTPLVLTYHMKTKATGWLGSIFLVHRWLVEPFVFWRARAIYVSSFDYARSVGLASSKLIEMPFGVDTNQFFPKEKQADALRFLFIGAMDDAHYFKGVTVLIEALKQLPKDAAWHVKLIGSGNLLASYRKQVEEAGLADRVEFLGYVKNEELPEVIAGADVHILPSIDRSEAYGLVTLEAAASGLASIVSDLPGVRTLVEEGVTGALVRPGDVASLKETLEWALNNQDRIARMGAAARGRVQSLYSHEVVLDKLQQSYTDVTVG